MSLYRAYRPQTFATVIGQAPVVQTLSNAIRHHRVGHAYILSGPRGTGKTSIARIMAKTLNCTQPVSPTEPCLTCDICRKITANQAPDVIELDAASHTSVEYIRDLNAQVAFYPLECKYKLYIIDEAHMLSNGAFNALLKTIEEPPKNIIFILATTEAHRIPKTVHSRCQHLVLNRLSVSAIQDHVAFICERERIQADASGLNLIAKHADGCMRDAITALDHVRSGADNADWRLTAATVQADLGLVPTEALLHLFHVMQDQPEQLIPQLDQLFQRGINPQAFVTEWLSLLKQAITIYYMPEQSSNQISDHDTEILLQHINPLSLDTLIGYLSHFGSLLYDLRHAIHPELAIYVRFLQCVGPRVKPPEANAGTQKKAVVHGGVPSQEVASRQESPKTQANAGTQKKAVVRGSVPSQEVASRQEPPATPETAWPVFLDSLKTQKPRLYMIIRGADFQGVVDGAACIRFQKQYQFFIEQLKDEATYINQCLAKIVPGATRLQVMQDAPESKPVKAVSVNDIIALFQGKPIESLDTP